MDVEYDPQYPRVEDLRRKAQQRIPGFAFDYLSGGCNEEVNLRKNTREIRDIELMPQYIREHSGSDLKTELFGHVYDAPFGIVSRPGTSFTGVPGDPLHFTRIIKRLSLSLKRRPTCPLRR